VIARKFLVIVNPAAGKGKYLDRLEQIKSEFVQRSIPYDMYFTTEDKKADLLADSIVKDKDFTDLMVVGGDGTINEAINGVRNKKLTVSIISFGTGNDTIKHIQNKFDFNSQINTAFNGTIRKIDAGECNGRLFLNGVGIGFDGKVVQRMAAKGKKFQGYFSYLVEVLRILLTYREREISATFNSITINEEILLMTIAKGTTFGGGFKINPYAINDDGLLDICIIGKVPNWTRINYVLKMKDGGHRKMNAVSFYKSSKVIIDENPALVAHMDGESIGSPPFHIQILPKAVSFRV
jgi:YegS/Rv2252/BmrU family lipid kinase